MMLITIFGYNRNTVYTNYNNDFNYNDGNYNPLYKRNTIYTSYNDVTYVIWVLLSSHYWALDQGAEVELIMVTSSSLEGKSEVGHSGSSVWLCLVNAVVPLFLLF